jgi:serine/threonine protein kinase
MDQHSTERHDLEQSGLESASGTGHTRAEDAPVVTGYSVCRRLGRGGSAEVWLLSEKSTGAKLALKCFDPPAGSAEAGRPAPGCGTAREEGVRREVLVMSVLDHEHLVKAHGVVRTGGAADGSFGILLDYAAGGSLQQLVSARGRLSVGETVTVLTPIAQVLGYLHGKGFTHSDVAPGNVLFTAHGKPLLADLGIARMVGDASGVPDRHTDGFTDPAPVDAVRAGLQPERDVYAAAALGWYCLTGQPPPPSAARPPLALLVPEVPAALAAALEAGLSDDRRRRPAAADLATAVYRSAPAEPLDLSRSVHDTVLPELLTRRPLPPPGSRLTNNLQAWGRRLKTTRWVRVAARLERVGNRAEPVRSRGGRVTRRGAQVRHRAERQTKGTRTAFSPSHGTLTLWSRAVAGGDWAGGGRRLAVAGTVLAAAVLAGAVFLGLAPAAPESGPSAPEPGPAVQESGAAAQPANTPDANISDANTPDSGIPANVRRQLGAKDPVAAVRGLAQLRSLALREGRLDLLDAVNAPDTPAHAADRAIRSRLEKAGTVLAGFRTSLSGVRRLPGGTKGRAVVAATSSATAYEEWAADGRVVAKGAAQQAIRLRLVLVPVEGRWRIADILPAE